MWTYLHLSTSYPDCGRTEVHQHPYRIPQVYQEAVEKEIEMMQKEGVIEPCVSV